MNSNVVNKTNSILASAFVLTLAFFLQISIANAAPSISFSLSDQTGAGFKVSEAGHEIHIQATLSEAVNTDVTFQYELRPSPFSTASLNNDFLLPIEGDPTGLSTRGTVKIPAFATTASIPITIINDRLKEDDEIISLFLSNDIGADLSVFVIDVQIIDEDDIPVITLSAPGYKPNKDDSIDAAIFETDGGINLNLVIESDPSDRPIEVQYEITYTPVEELETGEIGIIPDLEDVNTVNRELTGSIIIPATFEQKSFELTVLADAIPEGEESLVFKLLSADNGVIHGTQNILNLLIYDSGINSGAINDTGVANCYDAEKGTIGCDSIDASDFPNQDGIDLDVARYNRYQKLDANGDLLTDTATEWACVRDSNTQLIWQAKLISNGDTDNSLFTWYNEISSVNGGDAGFDGADSTDGTGVSIGNTCDITRCNTSEYVKSVNQNNLCGAGNWRLPRVNELLSIMDFEPDDYDNQQNNTVTNLQFFKDTHPLIYWTATPVSALFETAWCVHFGLVTQNHVRQCRKDELHYIRLVKTDNL